MADKVIAYKAFDKDFKCRDFQFEVGKTYEHEGEVVICNSGFHACLNPLDVLNYYDLTTSRFAEVEVVDVVTHGDDSKIATASLTITAELRLPDFIKKAIAWVFENCAKGVDNSGDDSKLAASGYNSKLAASGYNSQLAASGNDSKLAASGNDSKLAASGYNSQLAASGNDSKLAASGYNSQLAASGYNSQLAASGNDSKLAASGNDSQLAASGNDSKLETTGENSVIASSGINSKARGIDGTWISLAEFDSENKCIGFANGCIGQNGLKADVFYKAKNGALVKVEE